MSKFRLLNGLEIEHGYCAKVSTLLSIYQRVRSDKPTFVEAHVGDSALALCEFSLIREDDETKIFNFIFDVSSNVKDPLPINHIRGEIGDLREFSDYKITAEIKGGIHRHNVIRIMGERNRIMMGWDP